MRIPRPMGLRTSAAEDPNLSLGTVYRNLNLLVEENAIQRVMIGDGLVRYDSRLGDHAHFICTETGEITDMDAPAMDELVENFQRQTGHLVTSCRILFYGRLEKASHLPAAYH